MAMPLEVDLQLVVQEWEHSHRRVGFVGPRRRARKAEHLTERQPATMMVGGDGDRLVLRNRDRVTFASGIAGTAVAVVVHVPGTGELRVGLPDWNPIVVEPDEVTVFEAGHLQAEGVRQRARS